MTASMNRREFLRSLHSRLRWFSGPYSESDEATMCRLYIGIMFCHYGSKSDLH